MLARNAHDVYWLGRHLVRAEHTARMLDGLFHADLQGRQDDPTSVTLTWDSLLTIMGSQGEAGDGPAQRNQVIQALTLDPHNPVSIRACVERAREGARTVRDTISAEMWESVNTFNLGMQGANLDSGLRTGP
ncbi:MAG TPA: alpha-E domain-containing protein, partial [Thermoleophilaceae bacterium]|nr:alpha-E domain-containing protein [Thermoleophilaceae bacterium]